MVLLTKDRSFYRQYFKLLLFIAFQNLLSYSVSLLDNVMLARYDALYPGSAALNGAALANQLQFLLQMAVVAAGEGVVVLAAQYWGARRTDPIYPVACAGNCTGLVFSVLFFAAAAIFPRQILGLLSSDPSDIDAGVSYLKIIKYTYPVYCLSTVMFATMRSVENARIGFISMLISLAVNFFFNYCFIFGKILCSVPMGIEGAAYATLIARLTELAAIAVYTLKIDKKLCLTFRRLFIYRKTLWHDYFRYATPIMLGGASWGIAMFIQTSVIGHLKGGAVSANAMALSLFNVVTVFAYGGGNASGVLTGKIIGSGSREKLKEYVTTMQLLFLGTGLLTGGTIWALKEPVIRLYGFTRPTDIRYARQFLTVLSFTSIGSAYQAACLTGIVRGGGQTKFVFYNDLIFQWGIVLPFSLLAAYVWDLDPVWVFLILKSDQILKCFVAVVEVNRYHWIRDLTKKRDAHGQV